jgi:two-component system OmpR family sensor kinase
MNWRWSLTVLPLAIALGLALFLGRRDAANLTVVVRANLSVVVSLAGLILTLLAALLAASVQWRVNWQQAAAAQRRESTRARRQFLQRLDHELKNPLTAIRAALANFGDAPTPSARREALASVEAQTLRLSRLTGDLRKLAELETRQIEKGPVDLTRLLSEVVDLAQERSGAHQRRLTLSLPQAPWPLPLIAGDADLLFLAFYNLLENALKYTGETDTIEIRAREDGAAVVVAVADTGPGIDADDLPRVWDELYRGEGARCVPGSGLGLALVRAVVERHGGVVGVESRPGHGTLFNLRLPST